MDATYTSAALAGQQPKPFDYLESVDEVAKRLDEVSAQIRLRMTRPEETFIAAWVNPVSPSSWSRFTKQLTRFKKRLNGEAALPSVSDHTNVKVNPR